MNVITNLFASTSLIFSPNVFYFSMTTSNKVQSFRVAQCQPYQSMKSSIVLLAATVLLVQLCFHVAILKVPLRGDPLIVMFAVRSHECVGLQRVFEPCQSPGAQLACHNSAGPCQIFGIWHRSMIYLRNAAHADMPQGFALSCIPGLTVDMHPSFKHCLLAYVVWTAQEAEGLLSIYSSPKQGTGK